jgi:hypothetical protein
MAAILAKNYPQLQLYEKRMRKETIRDGKVFLPQTEEEIDTMNECASWFFAHELFYTYAILEPLRLTGVLPKDFQWDFPYCADLDEWLAAQESGDFTEIHAKCASFTNHLQKWFVSLNPEEQNTICRKLSFGREPEPNHLPDDIQVILGFICAAVDSASNEHNSH